MTYIRESDTPTPRRPAHTPELATDATAAASRLQSPAALLALIGAAIIVASYFLTWFRLESDRSVTISGWGITGADGNLTFSHLHWTALVAGVAVLAVATAHLLGRSGEAWHQAAILCVVLALSGALFSFAVVPEGAAQGAGAYVALFGSLASAAGCALMAFARR